MGDTLSEPSRISLVTSCVALTWKLLQWSCTRALKCHEPQMLATASPPCYTLLVWRLTGYRSHKESFFRSSLFPLSEISDVILISISSHCIWFYLHCFEELLLETCSHEDIVRPDLLTISLVYQMDYGSMIESNEPISSYWGLLSSWVAAMCCACALSLLQAEKMYTSIRHWELFFNGNWNRQRGCSKNCNPVDEQ